MEAAGHCYFTLTLAATSLLSTITSVVIDLPDLASGASTPARGDPVPVRVDTVEAPLQHRCCSSSLEIAGLRRLCRRRTNGVVRSSSRTRFIDSTSAARARLEAQGNDP